MRNSGLDEAQGGIKIAWRNINNLIYADNTALMADSVITHLEPDILECEVKWALESIATNKASGGDGPLCSLSHCSFFPAFFWLTQVFLVLHFHLLHWYFLEFY